jgi:hypothetical protein
MAEDGTVYGGYDEEFWEDGKSGIEALENIRAHSDYRNRNDVSDSDITQSNNPLEADAVER